MQLSTEKLRYHGTGGTLLGIFLVNALLTVLSMGIYSFWARTRLRQFYYGATELDGDRFAYHGTGGELLVGALLSGCVLAFVAMVFGLLMVATGAAGASGGPGSAQFLVIFGYMLTLVTLVAIAINGARRYRLSRSSWRGIRFTFRGRWQDYLQLMLTGNLLSVVTLGFYGPFYRNKSRAFLANHSQFGSLPFGYDGDGKDLFVQYLKALLLTIPTLGLCWVWYVAFRQRYFWSHTTLGPVRFRSTMTGGRLLGLSLTNVLLALLTLGIGIPWAVTRTMRYSFDTLALEGDIDWKGVEQQAQLASATGEGLAQGLDVDIDLGLGI